MRDDGVEICVTRRPAEFRFDGRRVGDESRGVASASRFVLHREIDTRHLLRRLDHFEHRESIAVAEVIGLAARTIAQLLEREPMCFAQIAHMHVIANAGAIGLIVVGAIHRQTRAPS